MEDSANMKMCEDSSSSRSSECFTTIPTGQYVVTSPRSDPQLESFPSCHNLTTGSKKASVQEWTSKSGCNYRGDMERGLRHGWGRLNWTSGESYEGEFYWDYPHGAGTYSWPDGSKFEGRLYLGQRAGYGKFHFPDGSLFQGLYEDNERLGPGVLTQTNGRCDVGLWLGQRFRRLCTPAPELTFHDVVADVMWNFKMVNTISSSHNISSSDPMLVVEVR
uniref:ankyrin repeat and MYND domain-containing protein 1-like n=1 Tax=Myxine glutinosa TaxID=7769 RepID=UPI0035901F85